MSSYFVFFDSFRRNFKETFQIPFLGPFLGMFAENEKAFLLLLLFKRL
jgi:hypothetical protein